MRNEFIHEIRIKILKFCIILLYYNCFVFFYIHMGRMYWKRVGGGFTTSNMFLDILPFFLNEV